MTIDAGLLFTVLFVGFVLIGFSIIVLWHILHFILCKKFDDQLFREPYFRSNELAVYSDWPLSLFRSMGYILLLGVPKLAKKRRFKDVNLDRANIGLLVLISRLFLLIGVFGIIFFLVIIFWAVATYMINE